MKKARLVIALVLIGATALLLAVFKIPWARYAEYQAPQTENFWGITYSKKFANSLGLDWRETYLAILVDLQAKRIRLPIYWDNIESEPGVYDFADYDWLIDQGQKRQTEFILVIGRRLPRWPECHAPQWLEKLPDDQRRQATLNLLSTIVRRYQNRPEVVAWQVENEPLLDTFGVCPPGDPEFLRQEVELVKALDKRPVIVTASGELSSWQAESRIGDRLGTTLYRTVWSPFLGYIHYPWPSFLYTAKGKATGLPPEKLMVAELQAEPWAPHTTLDKISAREAAKSFTIENFQSNLMYAADTGFAEAYLWGVEWWYLQMKRGDATYWNLAKTLW